MPDSLMLNAPKTWQGASRQFHATIKLYKRDFAGGGTFGFDWTTFRLNSPALYARCMALRTIARTLPST